MRWPLLCSLLITAPAFATDFQPLFNGKNLDGWVIEVDDAAKKNEKPSFRVEDSMIVCEGKGFGFLRYEKQEFGDFELHVEYRQAKEGNSGIGIRTGPFDPKKSTATRPSFFAYEVQLLDDAGKPADKHSTASLYRYVAPTENASKPAGEWNAIDINCVGPKIKITLNGKQVIDVDQSTIEEIKKKPLKGSICLQLHGTKAEFREVKIRDLTVEKGK
jgi:hypothetical protein